MVHFVADVLSKLVVITCHCCHPEVSNLTVHPFYPFLQLLLVDFCSSPSDTVIVILFSGWRACSCLYNIVMASRNTSSRRVPENESTIAYVQADGLVSFSSYIVKILASFLETLF